MTLLLIGLVLFLARHELVEAWRLVGAADLWVLALAIPAVIMGHVAAGEMMFSYLRRRERGLHLGPAKAVRLSMEMNFVNHVLPSGGVSGLSYMTWRMRTIGVSASRAAMAQVVRYAMQFVAFIVLLVIAVIVLAHDGVINRTIVLLSSMMVAVMVAVMVGVVVILHSRQRMQRFSVWATRLVNGVVRRISFGRVAQAVAPGRIEHFFQDLHDDYRHLLREKRSLVVPFIWGVLANLADVMLFMVVFWALGAAINPAAVFIAYGLASLSGVVVVTPGGAGAYEAIMVAFLSSAGAPGAIVLAGIVLARIILMLITIGVGYIVYQHAIIHYGRRHQPPVKR